MSRTARQRESASPSGKESAHSAGKALCAPQRMELAAGNFAIQRAVQASLRVGRADDPAEREADRVADAVASPSCGACPETAPCSACSEKRPRIARKAAAGAPSRQTWLPASRLARLGGGVPLDAGTRLRMQGVFGRGLDHVRIHTGSEAATSARSIDARAFTAGSDVVFDRGEYRPGTIEGDRLLAHELTHVMQNDGAEAPLRRVVRGNIREMSISAEWATALTDEELREQTTIVQNQLATLAAGTPEQQTAQNNLAILQAESRRRSPSALLPGQTVPRPAGLPLDQSFRLDPLPGVPDQVVAQIPEGQIVTISADTLFGVTPSGAAGRTADAAHAWAGAGVAADLGALRFGIAAAGENSVGIVIFPSQFSAPTSGFANFFEPHPFTTAGHAAYIVRQGGVITEVRSFGPVSGSFPRTALTSGQGVPGAVYNEQLTLLSTRARSMEWEVTAEQATDAANRLQQGESLLFRPTEPTVGAPNYTFFPSRSTTGATNCVGWACGQVAGEVPNPNLASAQGNYGVQSVVSEIDAASEVATVGRVAAAVPRYMRVMRIGGRVMLVASVALIPIEVYFAPPERRVETAVAASTSLAASLAAGALVGLLCTATAPVCFLVGLAVAGAVGFGTRAAVESAFEGNSSTASYRPQCPGQGSCHTVAPPNQFGNFRDVNLFGPPRSPLDLPPRDRTLSDADIAAIRRWLQQTAPAAH